MARFSRAPRAADAVFLIALSLAIGLASLPALTGSYIYDDWKMQASELMDGWDDARAVFQRSSADYLGRTASDHVGAVTFRPLTMLSLIAVQVLWPGSALAHHLLSLALHLAALVLLFSTIRALAGVQAARLYATIFGLHPLGIEAYGWINGRSDLVGALGVLLVAHALLATHGATATTRLVAVRAFVAFLGALMAGLGKETAQLGTVGVMFASLLRAGPTSPVQVAPRTRLFSLVASAAGILLSLLARSFAFRDVKYSSLGELTLPDVLRGLVRLGAVTVEQLLVPLPRTMDNLGFRLAEPASLGSLLLLALLAISLVIALLRGYLRAGVLALTAMGMVAPALLVRHTFWLGCDRYLYLPLALLCVALATTPLLARLSALPSSALSGSTALIAACLICATYFTAQTYHSQTDHMLSMMKMRPDDPSGYLIGVRWLWHRGQKEGALGLLAQVPRVGLPPPLASRLATVLAEVGKGSEALAVVADMEARYPDDPYVALDVVSVRLDEGRVREASAKAERLRGSSSFCHAVRALVDAHLERPTYAGAQGAAARAFLAGYRCP